MMAVNSDLSMPPLPSVSVSSKSCIGGGGDGGGGDGGGGDGGGGDGGGGRRGEGGRDDGEGGGDDGEGGSGSGYEGGLHESDSVRLRRDRTARFDAHLSLRLPHGSAVRRALCAALSPAAHEHDSDLFVLLLAETARGAREVGSAYLNLREMLRDGAEWRQHELRFVAAEGGVLGAISASTDIIPCLAALATEQPRVPGVVVTGGAAGGAAAAAGGRADPAVAPQGEAEGAGASEGGEGASAGRRAAQGEAGGGCSEAGVESSAEAAGAEAAGVQAGVQVGRGTSAARGVSAAGLLTSGVLPPRRGLLPPLQPRPWAATEPAAQAGGASGGDARPGCGPAAAPPPAPAVPAAAAPAVPAAAASIASSATRSIRSLFRVPSSELRVQVAPAPVLTQGLSPLPEPPDAGSPAADRSNANPGAAARSAVHRALASELEASCAWLSKATAPGEARRDSRGSRERHERRSSPGQVLPMG